MSAPERELAQALFQAAQSRGRLASVSEDLAAVTPLLLRESRFFLNPGVPAARQTEALSACLSGQADPLTVQFLNLLCARRLLRLLPRILARYDALCAEAAGEITVRLRIPYAPGPALLNQLRDALADWGMYPPERRDRVSFDIVIDLDLIGGFMAECNGRVLDASLKYRLFLLNK
ncbi:MAG: F0F1 ATP synthase subunit delta [Oscillospiraceae bacterium]|jgi:F-type H+-transporting ATPase subunit delta|nr:F0F1 ATP synthase subunit delta [Oscillospiraceae bacterium]